MTENGGAAKQGQRPQTQTNNQTRIRRPMRCRVLLLNGEEYEVAIDKRSTGQVLFENVCEYLDLLEKDYFGLQFTDDQDSEKLKYWLDLNKKVTKQRKSGKMVFEFAVKFYPPDPMLLTESLTRYLVSLQIRRNIISGRLPCSQATQAMLGSFAVQADIGDYEPIDHGAGVDYLRSIPFAPEQSDEMLYKIAAMHKQHKGQTPEQAELHYLEYSKKIPLYGIDLHKAKDSDYVDIFIGVGATGISVYRDNLRINRFVWPKILKISYRKNKFLLRIRPAEFETFESWIAFRLPSNKKAKSLWKIAVENHAFLRLRSAEDAKKRSGLPRFGSKYRYSGRTLHQTRLNASMADRPSKHFERSQSRQSLDSVLKSKSKSQENLYQPKELYSSQRIKNIQNLSLNIRKAETNRALIEDRTPFQSPLPIQESPKFISREIIRHHERLEEDDLEDVLPDVPEESPKPDRRSTSNQRIVVTSHVVVTTRRPNPHSESDRSSRGSMDSVDLRDDEESSQSRNSIHPKVAPRPVRERPPPVSNKPDKFSISSKTGKPPKSEKSSNDSKKVKEAAREVFM